MKIGIQTYSRIPQKNTAEIGIQTYSRIPQKNTAEIGIQTDSRIPQKNTAVYQFKNQQSCFPFSFPLFKQIVKKLNEFRSQNSEFRQYCRVKVRQWLMTVIVWPSPRKQDAAIGQVPEPVPEPSLQFYVVYRMCCIALWVMCVVYHE